MLVTHDEGRTWQKQLTLPPGFVRGVACVDANTCYAYGPGGEIATSSDGGQTWKTEMTPTFNEVDSLTCVGPGCLSGGGGIRNYSRRHAISAQGSGSFPLTVSQD